MSSLRWFDPASPHASSPGKQPVEERRSASMTLEKVPGGKAAIGANIDAMVAATMEAEMAGGGQPTRQSKVILV